jgi:hypothetical protein
VQLCWAQVIRYLTAIAERQVGSAELGAELLNLPQQLFVHLHQWKDAARTVISRTTGIGRAANGAI